MPVARLRLSMNEDRPRTSFRLQLLNIQFLQLVEADASDHLRLYGLARPHSLRPRHTVRQPLCDQDVHRQASQLADQRFRHFMGIRGVRSAEDSFQELDKCPWKCRDLSIFLGTTGSAGC